MGKQLRQDRYDHNRKTYRLIFPTDVSTEQIAAWLTSIGGTLRPRPFDGRPTLAFEVWSTEDGIVHRLKIPWHEAKTVIANLRHHIPGIRYNVETDYPQRLWTKVVELAVRNSRHQLYLPVPGNVANTLLRSIHPLEKGETVILQIVTVPSPRQHMPIYERPPPRQGFWDALLSQPGPNRDEVNDQRDKVSERNYEFVLRVGAVANSHARADFLIHQVKAILHSADSAAAYFDERKIVSLKALRQRLDRAASPLHFPAILTVTELSAVLAWPIDNPSISGLPRALARILPAPNSVPAEGRVIGQSNEPGHERKVAIPYSFATHHTIVTGPIGSGKTALLANMFRQDVNQGYGAVLVETKGDLFFQALDYIPPNRLDDVVILDVNDSSHPVGFNILQQGDPSIAIDELKGLFNHMFRDNPSLWMNKVLHHGLHTLQLDPQSTFVDLMALLSPMADELVWRDDLVRQACKHDPQLRSFWQDFDNETRRRQDEITAPLANRIWVLNTPKLRNILGQSDSSFQMEDIVRGGKILLVNLSGIERDAATLMGTLITNALWQAIRKVRPSTPVFLTLDEFQRFLHLPLDTREMLEQARSMGLGMTLAHQNIGQLDKEMAEAVNANARNKIAFQSESDDAAKMARVFGNLVTEQDMMNLARFEAMVKVSTADGVSPPLTLTTYKPAKGYETAQEVVRLSRERYGRPVEAVQTELLSRHIADPNLNRRPAIGDVPYGL